jgi:hypothetical protein
VRGTDVQHSQTGETVMGMQLALVLIVLALLLVAIASLTVFR